MKVLILNNDFRAYWKDRLIYLHKFLNSQGIEFNAIEIFGQGSPYVFDNYNNREYWWSCLYPDKSSEQLLKKQIKNSVFTALDTIMPDIIIAPSIVFYAGALAIRWAKKNHKKFIMFDDAKPSQVKRNLIVQWVKDIITVQADGLWFPAAEYKNDYKYFYNKGLHLFYGFNCIDNQLFRSPLKKQLDHKIIICVARLVPVKNIDNLFKAWKIVEQENVHYKLIIIGSGPEYNYLNELKMKLALTSVQFIDAVNNNMVPQYFYNADAFILPSHSESWGLVVNEAMAAGLPVLLSKKINAAHILLKEGKNGFGFEPDNVREMSAAILKYINLDIDSKQIMSSTSLQIIDSMSYDNMGSRLIDALNIIERKKTNSPGLIASIIMNFWYGRYNKTGWDKK